MSGDWPMLLAVAESEVRHILRALPGKLQAEARRLPVTFERRPGKELQDDGIEPDTLGLFVGEAYPDSETGSVPLPPQITLFLTNIWTMAEEDEAVYREQIRTTFLHELGHYLGLDEIDLEERGLD
jgi:predicted Zn-dependent protease with MMP-like domain